MTDETPDLTDPDWLPTDQEELAVLDSVARRVAWEKAMAAEGIKVLALRLTLEEEQARIDAWTRATSDQRSTASSTTWFIHTAS